MKKGCLFCSISRGETTARVVHTDETSMTFLDHRPLFYGHCLVIPKLHYETLVDIPTETIGAFFSTVQLVTRAVVSAMQADGAFMANNNVVSQSVPHLHVHVVPRRRKDGLRGFFWPRHKYESEEAMAAVQHRITESIKRLE